MTAATVIAFHTDGTICQKVTPPVELCDQGHEWWPTDEPWPLGKYATYADAYAEQMVDTWEGSVESPAGAYAALTLEAGHPLASHYPSVFLVVMQNDQGFVQVIACKTPTAHKELLSTLDFVHSVWLGDE